MSSRLLSPEEVADILRVPKSTLYGWRQTGDGPSVVKVGRLLRYDADDVELWIKSRKSHR